MANGCHSAATDGPQQQFSPFDLYRRRERTEYRRTLRLRRKIRTPGHRVFAAHQLGAALAAWLGGVARDQFGGYAEAFLAAGLLALVGAGLAAMIGRGRAAAGVGAAPAGA